MNILKSTFIIFLLYLSSACSSYDTYSTGSSTAEKVSYLYFTGNITDAKVIIDDSPAFTVTKSGIKNQYKVSPGRHIIKVIKSGNVIVKRDVLLGNGHEKEIHIP